MHWIAHSAPVATAVSASGATRSIADSVACGECAPDAALIARALEIVLTAGIVGKVHSHGKWTDPAIHAHLSAALGAILAPALRNEFEWYQCRGAFFHNDAHYDARLFGVWYIGGPPAEIVFPRAGLRLAAVPGSVLVFDPFEVHGVLAPGLSAYAASDYEDAEASVLIGFELDITPAIADAFGIRPGVHGRAISSQTRITADDGALR